MITRNQVRDHLLSKWWEWDKASPVLYTMVGKRIVRIYLKQRVIRIEEKLDRYGGYWWHRIGGAKYKNISIKDGRLDGIESIY